MLLPGYMLNLVLLNNWQKKFNLKKKIVSQKIRKKHWFQLYITTWVKEFQKWTKNVKISYFWAKLAVGAKNSLFWRFWPISGNLWPKLLYIVGISDFFLIFLDKKN